MKMKKVSYIQNEHHITVKVWCASCEYKEMTRASSLRRCRKLNKDVKPHHCCKCWEMSEQLQLAGMSLGVVRDKDTKVIIIN